MKTNNYFFLSAFFFAVYLIFEFTEIFGDSSWFKFFLVILFITFLISGISIKLKKNKNKS